MIRPETQDGRTVKYTPRMRGIIHPDERRETAKRVRFTYRTCRTFDIGRTQSRSAARTTRVDIACCSELPLFDRYIEEAS